MKINFLCGSLGLGKGGYSHIFVNSYRKNKMTYAPRKLAGELLNHSQISFRKFIKTLFGNDQVLASHSARGKSVTLFKKLFGYLG